MKMTSWAQDGRARIQDILASFLSFFMINSLWFVPSIGNSQSWTDGDGQPSITSTQGYVDQLNTIGRDITDIIDMVILLYCFCPSVQRLSAPSKNLKPGRPSVCWAAGRTWCRPGWKCLWRTLQHQADHRAARGPSSGASTVWGGSSSSRGFWRAGPGGRWEVEWWSEPGRKTPSGQGLCSTTRSPAGFPHQW